MTCEAIKQLTFMMDVLPTHTKMLETKIAKQATLAARPSGKLPGQPRTNIREHYNAIIDRSDKQLEEP